MKALNLIESRLDDIRAMVEEELLILLKQLRTDGESSSELAVHIINPYSNQYVYTKKIFLNNEDKAVIELENKDEHSPVAFSCLHSFDMLLVLRQLYMLNVDIKEMKVKPYHSSMECS